LQTGLAIAALYLAAAGLSFRGGLVPALPLLDGTGPPPPYQWVKPPPDRLKDNTPPSAGEGTIPLTALGSSGSVTTPDGQAQVLFDNDSVPPLPGQTAVSVTLKPLDPDTVGPPPDGLGYDSNAYEIDASYKPSGQPVEQVTATVVMTFATKADRILRWTGSSWEALPSTPAGTNVLFAIARKFGIFATAGANTGLAPKQTNPVVLVLIIVGIFAVILAVLVVVIVRSRASRDARPGRPRRR